MSLDLATPSSSRRVDRRARPRVRVTASVTMMVDGRLVDAVAIDVSSGGVRVVADARLAVGTRLTVVLIVAGEIVDARATVRWAAPRDATHHTLGIAFDDVDPDVRAQLAAFCSAGVS